MILGEMLLSPSFLERSWVTMLCLKDFSAFGSPKGVLISLTLIMAIIWSKFDRLTDKEFVMNGGPWMLSDHHLYVSQWTLEFASPNANIQITLIWILFLGLNLLHYNENVLMGMASVIG